MLLTASAFRTGGSFTVPLLFQLLLLLVLLVLESVHAAATEQSDVVLVRPAPPAPTDSDGSNRHAFLEVSCFTSLTEDGSIGTSPDDSQQRQRCCDAIQQALAQGCRIAIMADELCSIHMARVPPISQHGNDGSHPWASPRMAEYVLLLPSATASCASSCQEAEVWMQGGADREDHNRWMPFNEAQTLIRWQLAHSSIALFPKRDADDTASLRMSLTSSLSNDGGMHRLLHHVIDLPEPLATPLRIFMALHIPDAIFMDLDDAQEGQASSSDAADLIDVTYHAAETIDIEQPAFASPSHLVLVEVSISNGRAATSAPKEGGRGNRQIMFASKLHLRYPQPTNTNKLKSAWRNVVVSPPQIVFAETQNAVRAFPTHPAHDHAPIITYVAAGDEADYPLVVFVTFASAIAGAFVMLRDILQACEW